MFPRSFHCLIKLLLFLACVLPLASNLLQLARLLTPFSVLLSLGSDVARTSLTLLPFPLTAFYRTNSIASLDVLVFRVLYLICLSCSCPLCSFKTLGFEHSHSSLPLHSFASCETPIPILICTLASGFLSPFFGARALGLAPVCCHHVRSWPPFCFDAHLRSSLLALRFSFGVRALRLAPLCCHRVCKLQARADCFSLRFLGPCPGYVLLKLLGLSPDCFCFFFRHSSCSSSLF